MHSLVAAPSQGVPPLLSSFVIPLSFTKLLPARVLAIAAVSQQQPEQQRLFSPAQELLRVLPATCSVPRPSIAAHADVFLAAPLAPPPGEDTSPHNAEPGGVRRAFAADPMGWHFTWMSTALADSTSDSDVAEALDSIQQTGSAPAALPSLEGSAGPSPPPQLLLIPAHRCLLAERSFFFRTLFSGRWESIEQAPQPAGSSASSSVSGSLNVQSTPGAEPQDGDMVTLPVVRLEEADAEALLQLLSWVGTGRMQLLPALAAAPAAAEVCAGCHPRRTGVLSASLAGRHLIFPSATRWAGCLFHW